MKASWGGCTQTIHTKGNMSEVLRTRLGDSCLHHIAFQGLLCLVLLLVHTAGEEPCNWASVTMGENGSPSTKSLCPDDNAITFRYETAEFFQTSRKTIGNQDSFRTPDSLEFLQDVDEEGCRAACVAQEGCAVYEFQGSYINANRIFAQVPNPSYPDFRTSCSLFSSGVFEDRSKVAARPFGSGRGKIPNIPSAVTVAGVKCYYPPPVCDAPHVRQLTGEELLHERLFSASDTMRLNVAHTRIQVGPDRDNIVMECANLCALGPTSERAVEGGYVGMCKGFAIEDDLCTLLYPADNKHSGSDLAPFQPLLGTEKKDTAVFRIDDCMV